MFANTSRCEVLAQMRINTANERKPAIRFIEQPSETLMTGGLFPTFFALAGQKKVFAARQQ